MNLLLHAQNLSWRANNKTIVNIKDLQIHQGERIALIGNNGAGKSSLIRLLALLQEKSSGTLSYPGIRSTNQLTLRRQFSMMFQEANLLKGTVLYNVSLGLKLRGINKKNRDLEARRWLSRFGIEHLAYREARNLSGGEAKRVSLARALVTQPTILFLDEPFSALDLPTRSSILLDLLRIVKEAGITMVFITHHPAEIPLLANRVLVMEQGRIIQDAPPRDVFERPATKNVAQLMGYENILEGTVKEHKFLLPDGQFLMIPSQITIPQHQKVHLFLQANDLRLHNQGKKAINTLELRIKHVIPIHDAYQLQCEGTPPITVTIKRNEFMDLNLEPGHDILVHIPDSAMVFAPIHDGQG